LELIRGFPVQTKFVETPKLLDFDFDQQYSEVFGGLFSFLLPALIT